MGFRACWATLELRGSLLNPETERANKLASYKCWLNLVPRTDPMSASETPPISQTNLRGPPVQPQTVETLKSRMYLSIIVLRVGEK